MNSTCWRGTLSLFPSVADTRARQLPVTWTGLAEFLEQPKIRADKGAGELFSAALFTGKRRKNENAQTLCALVLDYDHAPEMGAALAAWQDAAHLAYTTWSHGTPEKGNAYRVLVPLAEPIPAALYPALWALAYEHSGGAIDAACKDPARIMYLPSVPEERRGLFQSVRHDGPALDWRALCLDAPEAEAPATARTSAPRAANPYVDKAVADALRKIATAPEGTRNRTLNAEAHTLGQLVAADWAGLDRGDAERALLAAATTAGLLESEARATIKSGLDSGAKKPRPKPAERTPRINRGESAPTAATATTAAPAAPSTTADNADAKPDPEVKTKLPKRFALDGNTLRFGDTENPDTKKIESHPIPVCGRLEVLAATRNPRGDGVGRLLKFKTRSGRWRELVIPMELVASEGGELVKLLLNRDLRVFSPHLKTTKARLAEYVNDCEPAENLTTTDSTGWHGGAFVLTGGEMIGGGEKVIFTGADTDIYAARGTLADWQRGLAGLCVGNSRLEFAVSIAFAGVLMPLTGDDGAGVNFYGTTSTGKTTTQVAAASVWGSPEPGGFISKWNATATSLELQAVQRNHTLFCIDELGEVDPKQAGRLIYQLASGVQKGRGKADVGGVGMADLKTWKLPFISSAEKTLAQHVEDGGARLYGGQAVRCVDVPADAGAGFGAFEHLHGQLEAHGGNAEAAGAAFSDLIKSRARAEHGTAGRAFVAALLKLGTSAALKIVSEQRAKWVAAYLPHDAGGVGRRAAKLFSLSAAAGELAIHLKVLTWEQGAALAAAGRCFTDWLHENGAGNPEERAALAGLAYFLETNAANFRRWHETDPHEGGRVIPRAVGWLSEDEDIYYILPEIFKRDACKGYRAEFVLGLLARKEALITTPGRRQYQIRPPKSAKPVLVYAVKADFQETEKPLLTPLTVLTDAVNNNKNNNLHCKQSVSSLYAPGKTVSTVSSGQKSVSGEKPFINNAVSSVSTVSSEKHPSGKNSARNFAQLTDIIRHRGWPADPSGAAQAAAAGVITESEGDFFVNVLTWQAQQGGHSAPGPAA